MKTPIYMKYYRSYHIGTPAACAANELAEMGEVEGAIVLLRNLVDDGCKDYGILRELAVLYWRCCNYDEAIRSLDAALEVKHDDLDAYEMMAEMYLEQGRDSKTIEYCTKLLELCPTDLNAYDILYFVYLKKGMLDMALNAAIQLVKLDPYSAGNHYKKAFVHYEMADVNSTIYELSQVLSASPGEDMLEEARNILDQLDSLQIRHVIAPAMEDFIFRMKLVRDPESAALGRGYLLSHYGLEILRQIEFDNLPDFYSERRQLYYD